MAKDKFLDLVVRLYSEQDGQCARCGEPLPRNWRENIKDAFEMSRLGPGKGAIVRLVCPGCRQPDMIGERM